MNALAAGREGHRGVERYDRPKERSHRGEENPERQNRGVRKEIHSRRRISRRGEQQVTPTLESVKRPGKEPNLLGGIEGTCRHRDRRAARPDVPPDGDRER